MPKTIDALVSSQLPANQLQQNASLSLHRPLLHSGHQALHALTGLPLQPALRLHGEGEQLDRALLQGPKLPRLRRQVPGRVAVRALHVQHEQARSLPRRLLSLLLLRGSKTFKWSLGLLSQVVHLANNLLAEAPKKQGLTGSSTIGHENTRIILLKNNNNTYLTTINAIMHSLPTMNTKVKQDFSCREAGNLSYCYCTVPNIFCELIKISEVYRHIYFFVYAHI